MARDIGGADLPGQTPLDADEADALRIPIVTRADLNTAEAVNVAEGLAWLSRRKPSIAEILSEPFIKELHLRLFGDVWEWAGEYRRSDKNLGAPWPEIGQGIAHTLADAKVWIESSMDRDEVAVRYGHRLVATHPFPNGNGRHSRAISDALAVALGQRAFSWGKASDLGASGDLREHYISALRKADAADIADLVAFARS